MKKIINGRKYDTTTATCITEKAYYNNGNWSSTRELFRKKNGEFFFAVYGNRMDCFAPDNQIKPITESEAKEFAEENMTVEAYEIVFGNVEE